MYTKVYTYTNILVYIYIYIYIQSQGPPDFRLPPAGRVIFVLGGGGGRNPDIEASLTGTRTRSHHRQKAGNRRRSFASPGRLVESAKAEP